MITNNKSTCITLCTLANSLSYENHVKLILPGYQLYTCSDVDSTDFVVTSYGAKVYLTYF